MAALNARITPELMDRVKLAKVLKRLFINDLVAQALGEWLDRHGIGELPKPDPDRKPKAK